MSEVKDLDMEKLLTGLFDFQKFEADPTLQRLIDEVEGRLTIEELSDDALSLLSAAGNPYSQSLDLKKRNEPL